MSRVPAAADVFRAVADVHRRALLDALASGEVAVGELAQAVGLSYSAVSQHLAILRDAGLVENRKAGRQQWYRLEAGPLRELHTWTSHYERFWRSRLTRLKHGRTDAMRLDLSFTEFIDAPIEDVWRAMTDSRLLAQWLMENDFEAQLGARFTLRSVDPVPGWRGWIDCQVLELQPPTRMVWSWSDSAEPTVSRVIFELHTEGSRTRLSVRHVGDEGEAMAKMIRERWPIKVRALASILGDEE